MNTRECAIRICPGRLLLLILLMCGLPVNADEVRSGLSEKLLILDFELNDLTMNPDVDAEKKRVESLRPLLSSALSYEFDHQIMELSDAQRQLEDKGKGYLFDRPQVTAKMAKKAGADWVVSGRLHKASFLFVYLKAQLIEASSSAVKADFVVEIKGWEPRLTRKGVETLALQIDESLSTLVAGQ